ncbi:hypothetical protein SLS63_011654 [Diaporthe eres]|uniref:Uncharacterized protein n=1 Tax=Diaporthe eres TaxID=83184 RepID=A0ABR1NTF0_DIAER
MQSLVTVNNNVSLSLVSVTIAPSTALAIFTIALVFLALYLPPLSFRSARHTDKSTSLSKYKYYDDTVAHPTNDYRGRFASYFDYNNTWWYPYWSRNRAQDPIELRDHPPLTEGLPQPRATLALEDSLMPFDPHDHLEGSLQDFESVSRSPPPFRYPSTHSGFLKSDTEADLSEMENSTVSAGGYSPPAWRRLGNGDRSSGFWRKGDNLLGYGGLPPQWRSRESSPEYDSVDEDCDDDQILAAAIRTRLPTGSMSPEKERSPEPDYMKPRFHNKTANRNGNEIPNAKAKPNADADTTGNGEVRIKSEEPSMEDMKATLAALPQKDDPENCMLVTKSWSSIILSALVAFLSISATRALFEPAYGRPVPDLVKVAGIARSFEPLIYYSENGVAQVGDLQATGVAVWDLGESVRSSNLTSAPIIVKELDELSDSLKTLAIELTKFFANVDGDIDGILIVMDWARRELSQVASLPSAPLTSAFDNIHTMLTTAGVLETPTGTPTRLGAIATTVFGMSNPQRTRQTLQRTFNEFLAVLEEAINNELQHSLALFGLFESIDHQFLNLARTVVRESNAQDELHADLLSSLWTRILGPRASDVKKYERNRLLLQNVREKTVRNKGILVEHNHKLLALKANLESLRRKLVSPLVRSVNSSTLTVGEQIRGLEDVGVYLEGVRTRQKGKLMEMLYGGGSNVGRDRLIEQQPVGE